jgi:transposase-like protein
MGTKDKERRVYPAEFKAEAVALAGKHEKPVRQVAADLGINENIFHRRLPKGVKSTEGL